MAEVFGLAAAGIGMAPIALELAKMVKKLKDYCRDVKSAGDDIRDFIDEAEALHVVLLQLDSLDIFDCPASSASLQRCHDLCTKANSTLSGVVLELQSTIKTQSRRTQLAFPLKREKIKQLVDKVAGAKSSLLLACNVYLMWQTKANALAQQQMLSEVLRAIQSQESNHSKRFEDLLTGTLATRQSYEPTRRHAPAIQDDDPNDNSTALGLSRRQRPPPNTTTTTRIWNFCSLLATQGWMQHFRSYRIVYDDYNNPAFTAVIDGDLVSLQRLICDGKATIYDQTSYGAHMLLTAVQSRQMHVFRWLRRMTPNIEAATPDDPSRLLSSYMYHTVLGPPLGSVEDVSKDTRMILETLDFDVDNGQLEIHQRWGANVQHVLYPWTKAMYQWGFQDCLAVTRWHLHQFYYELQTELLKSLLRLQDNTEWRNAMWQHRDECGFTLMHTLADAYMLLQGSAAEDCRQVLRGSIRQAMRASADAMFLFDRPAEDHLMGFCHKCDWRNDWQIPILSTSALRSWLQALADEGFDLQRQGELESRAWRRRNRNTLHGAIVYGFTYGSLARDWAVQWENLGDRFAGMFWDMVEHPERQLPGAWFDLYEVTWEEMVLYNHGDMRKWRQRRHRHRRNREQKQRAEIEEVVL